MTSRPDLTIIVPACNEQDRLPGTLGALMRWKETSALDVELIVVDDGSEDGTGRILEEASADGGLRVISFPRNRGKGTAVRAGFSSSAGDAVLFMDADLAYGLSPVAPALQRLEEGADLVIGARDLAPVDSRWRYSPLRRASTAGFNLMVDGMLPLGIPDTQCGFKAFRGPVARRLADVMTRDGFSFDLEILVIARLWSLRIDRIPVEMCENNGSSIRLLADSLQMGRDLVKIRHNALKGTYLPRPEGL